KGWTKSSPPIPLGLRSSSAHAGVGEKIPTAASTMKMTSTVTHGRLRTCQLDRRALRIVAVQAGEHGVEPVRVVTGVEAPPVDPPLCVDVDQRDPDARLGGGAGGEFQPDPGRIGGLFLGHDGEVADSFVVAVGLAL